MHDGHQDEQQDQGAPPPFSASTKPKAAAFGRARGGRGGRGFGRGGGSSTLEVQPRRVRRGQRPRGRRSSPRWSGRK